MILCRATVEVIQPPTPHRIGRFEGIVMGDAPHDYMRTYRIEAKSDSLAARQGIDRFVDEISALTADSAGID